MDIVIIEDEDLAVESLKKLLSNCPHPITIKKRLESVEQSISWFKNNTCDLILSDIHLGDGESFKIFESLHIKTPIIFTTAFDKYAIKSFQFFAIDYLLKPYDQEKLNAAIEKYSNFDSKNFNNHKLERLLSQINSPENTSKKHRFLVSKGNRLIPIKIEDIAYFMAQGKHLFLYTKLGESYLYKDTISNLEEQLPNRDFFKINRKYIVHHTAIKNIFKYSNNRIKVELQPKSKSEELIFVSTQKNSEFKDWLNN